MIRMKQNKSKPILKSLAWAGLIVASLILHSCEEADSEKNWGIAKVYMPQASLQSGEADNNYYVPSGSNEFNKNYTVEGSTINVVLGVYRSGLQELQGYTVDVISRADTINQLITDGVLANAALLPDDTYSIPGNLTVPDGEREMTFHLSIDRNAISANYPSFVGMNLVLAVGITNPSRYELNQSLSTTIVIVRDDWATLE